MPLGTFFECTNMSSDKRNMIDMKGYGHKQFELL